MKIGFLHPARLALTLPALVCAGLAGWPAAASTKDVPPLGEIVSTTSLSGSYLAAQVAVGDNDDEAAVAFFQRGLDLDPENGEMKEKLFLSLLANGRVGDGVKLAGQLKGSENQSGVSRLVLAVDALRQKSWAKVEEILKEPAGGELDAMVESLLTVWAVAGSGDTKRAIETGRTINGPDWVSVIRDYHLGLITAAGGDDKGAQTFFKSATRDKSAAALLTSTYLRAIEALYRSQSRSGDKEGAQATLAGGLELLPNHPPFQLLASTAANTNALAPLVVAPNQGAAEIFYDIATAVSRNGGSPFAQSYLQLADFLNPGSDVVAVALAEVFEKQKKPARANLFYNKIKADSPYVRRAKLERALNLNELKQVDEAETLLNDLIAQNPDDLIAYQTLGGVLSQQEKYREAADVYDRAAEIAGEPEASQWNLFYRRGVAYERLKLWDKAEPNFKKALELAPNQPDVLNYLGYSWVDMGINLDEGMAMIRKAVELKPRSGFIIDSLGWAHYRLKQYPQAVAELERAIELMPQDPVLNDHLGDAYWRIGRKLEATFQWNHALVSEPTPEDEAIIRGKLEKGLQENQPPTALAD